MTFLLNVTAQTGQDAPPRDPNPDCNVEKPEGHVYKQCEFKCEGDEMILLTHSQACRLDEASLGKTISSARTGAEIRGVCLNGNCVPNLEDIEVPSSLS
ncbi:hypothetical protein V5799_001489 [Amblyomma americanum]|uniref:Evasin n=1 Tax=Amblyomma americanum TaxID=6943 RepID=A0AAQ4D019_AMBAM